MSDAGRGDHPGLSAIVHARSEKTRPSHARQRRGQRRRQARREPRAVRQLRQQIKARVRHDPRAAASDVKTAEDAP
jgi:hypothetical protein